MPETVTAIATFTQDGQPYAWKLSRGSHVYPTGLSWRYFPEGEAAKAGRTERKVFTGGDAWGDASAWLREFGTFTASTWQP